jgi:hypothetical protein
VRMSEDKVRTKDSCWSVGTIYDPRELLGVSTAGPGIGRGVTRTVVPDGFTPRPRTSSSSGHTPGSPEAKLEQTLSYNNLDQIALPPTVSHAHSMCGSPDTLSSHARLSRQGQNDHSHFAPLLIVLTGKQHYSPCFDYCANHQGKTNDSKSRPPPSSALGATGSSASPDLRPRPQPQPR